MYTLSDRQVDFILEDLLARGVTTDSLRYNLLDHICCIIEQELQPGEAFEPFYREVVRRFYQKELRELEAETTLLLTFKHYYAMKKVMMWSGLLTVAAFIVGSVFKILQWPGASILLVLGFAGISLLFLPLLFLLKIRETPAVRDRVILALGIVAGSLYFLAMLFHLQHWPGARILWFGNLILSFFIFLPLYFFSGIRRPETRVNTIVSSILLMAVIGSQFALTSLYRPQPPRQVATVAVQTVAGK